MGRRRGRGVIGMAAALVTSALMALSGQAAARADVGLCASFPTPSSESQALRRAPFAFDGVAIGGRRIQGEGGEPGLVSPLTFRVIRWIKDGPSHGVVLPSGTEGIRLWDGRYARLPHSLLRSYSRAVRARFRGEIVAVRGQRWRVYATAENDVNFTCTNMLGSHPLGASGAPLASPSPGHAGPRHPSARAPRSSVPWVLVVLGVAVAGLLTWAATRRTRRRPVQS
jgi:hypothetical protein